MLSSVYTSQSGLQSARSPGDLEFSPENIPYLLPLTFKYKSELFTRQQPQDTLNSKQQSKRKILHGTLQCFPAKRKFFAFKTGALPRSFLASTLDSFPAPHLLPTIPSTSTAALPPRQESRASLLLTHACAALALQPHYVRWLEKTLIFV